MKRVETYCIILLTIIMLSSCESNIQRRESSSFVVGTSECESETSEVIEKEENNSREACEYGELSVVYELATLLPEDPSGEIYYWVFLQNGRKMVNQKDVQQINDRLHELGVESSVGFHIITIEDYITPEVLTQVYEDLDGQMDFVSIGSALCGFYMNEWDENFIELSNELRNGKLREFYATVPEIVWDANRINDGIYSFSNSTEVAVRGFVCTSEVWEKCGKEVLYKINEANGIEKEEIWEYVYKINGEAVCIWSGLYEGKIISIKENPYARHTLSKLANGFEGQYYSFFTDDIRYNLETEQFEWLVNSDKYIEIKDGVEEFYKKGYLGSSRMAQQDESGHCGMSNTGRIKDDDGEIHDLRFSREEETDNIFVPVWQEARISRYTTNRAYMYSCVYKEAKNGWEGMLNILGKDEEISKILNGQEECDVTIAAVVFEYPTAAYVLDIDDQYEMVTRVYEEAQPDPIGNFIFNPVPIKDEWEEYNRAMSAFDGIRIAIEPTQIGEYQIPSFESLDLIWQTYQERKEEAHIDLVLAEVNRQYTEWKNSQAE